MTTLKDEKKTNLRKKIIAVTLTAVTTIGAFESSFAEYYVSAFDHGKAFSQLMNKNGSAAKEKFPNLTELKSDYADNNNLCVSQILSAEYPAAISSCESAIESMPPRSNYQIRSDKSHIYTNLAVAKALMGNGEGAIADLKRSLDLNKSNKNASRNYDRLLSFQLAD